VVALLSSYRKLVPHFGQNPLGRGREWEATIASSYTSFSAKGQAKSARTVVCSNVEFVFTPRRRNKLTITERWRIWRLERRAILRSNEEPHVPFFRSIGLCPPVHLFGTGRCGDIGCGVVSKLNKKGTETVIRRFTGGADGAHPSFGSLIMDSAGNLYGTTDSGGPPGCANYACAAMLNLFSHPDHKTSGGITSTP
jgi:hypothetical protein